ncbi:hypothetical protein QEZ48_07235 [Aquamicrobium lusatiense]|nr:hypothetical protein [Aquamicrobium lusatiense]MDH4990625.1 hypothetical protein [Aquamicrobium lusatiense]
MTGRADRPSTQIWLVFGLNAGRRLDPSDAHELRVVDIGAHQILGELRADARRYRIGIDGMIDDAKTLAGLQVLIEAAHRRRIDEREARLIGLQCGAVELAPI